MRLYKPNLDFLLHFPKKKKSKNYINLAIFSQVRLQSKNINPNLTSFVVETVNTALGPACKTNK